MKKIISLVTLMLFSSVSLLQVDAATNVNTTKSTNACIPFSKLNSISNSLINKVNKDFNNLIKDISDKDYTTQLTQYKNDILSELREDLNFKYVSPFCLGEKELPKTVLKYKKVISDYKEIMTDISKFKKDEKSNLLVSAEEKSQVEANILQIQKDIVSNFKEELDPVLNYDSKTDWKWKMSFSFKDPITWEKWTISLDITKSEQILSLVNKSQEMSFSTNYNLDLPGFNWKWVIDAAIKVIENTYYLTLNDFTIESTWLNNENNSELNMIVAYVSMFKWKTYKMDLASMVDNQSDLASNNIMYNLPAIIKLLQEKPLFTAYKKSGNWYVLMLKWDSITSLVSTSWNNLKPNDLLKIQKSFIKTNLVFVNNSWVYTISNPLNENFSITYKNSKDFNVSLKANDDDFNFDLSLSYKKLNLNLLWEDMQLKANWENDYLTVLFDWFWQKIEAKWDYSTFKADLELKHNSKSIWYIKANKISDKKYDYSYYFNIESEIFNFFMDLKWEMNLGKFDITVPTDTIDLNSMMKSMMPEME